jgi:hypothetical protein
MQWGRKQYRSWPSRTPVWAGVALGVLAVMVCSLLWQYAEDWTFLERYYLPMYVRTWARGNLLPTNQSRYVLIDVVFANGKERTAVDREIDSVTQADGTLAYALTDDAQQRGAVKVALNDAVQNDKELHAYLGLWIYRDGSILDDLKTAGYSGSVALFVLFCFAIPEDKKRALWLKHGRQLKGPELVTTAEFNRRLRRPEGIALLNEERSLWDRLMRDELSRSLRIPRPLETKHFMLMGDTGTGKTTSLAAVREAAERAGYEVEGLAPTSRAAQKLGEAGMETQTLQKHLARGVREDDGQKRLYVVDESSMASTRQMHTFVERLKEDDRVLFVGDTRQHEAVEAGRPYAQLQEAGLRTAHLDEIIRQKDPALKETVEQLARGEVKEAIGSLDRQGRVHEIEDRHERISEIAREYVRQPENTLVVSPDNESRREINQHIHRAMQAEGKVSREEHRVHVLHTRQDITGADRQYAQNYETGDVLRYSKGSKPLDIDAGEYGRVARTDRESNTVTVTRESGEELSYDPRRLQGVTIYRDTERNFSEGDRVQMTAPYREQKLANRELGTVEKINDTGDLRLKMDSGREVEFNVKQHPHLDYGYAVTSHSSQGQTADRVLIHIDSEHTPGSLLNSRMAYVSVSRAQYDVQMFTNDKEGLSEVLSRDITKATALSIDETRQISHSLGNAMAEKIGISDSQAISGPAAAYSRGF